MKHMPRQILKKVKNGDENAFVKLINLYQQQVYQVCFRMTGSHGEAEILAQDIFLKVYLNIKMYNGSKHFTLWLMRIAANRLNDWFAKNVFYFSNKDNVSNDNMMVSFYPPVNNQQTIKQITELEFQDEVQKQLIQLTPKYRFPIILIHMEDLTVKEISEIIQIPIPKVKARIHHGREMLRKRLSYI